MRRGLAAAMLVVATSCIAPAQSIGALDEQGSESGAGVTGLPSTTTTGEVGSETSLPEVGSSTGGSGCETPCVAYHDCQQARCVRGECALSFRDELCEPGQVCSPSGCVAEPLSCDSEAVLLCEDFETDTFSPRWVGGSIGRSQALVHNGAYAGEVSVAPDERQQLYLDVDPPLAEGMLALRAFVRVPGDDPLDDWVIFHELFGRMNAGTERYSLDLKSMFGLQYVALPGAMSGPSNPSALPPDTWACVELRIEISDTDGVIEIRVNDVVVDSNDTPIDTLPSDGFANINVGGVGSPANAGTYTFLLDDLVIATVPIGCEVSL